MDIREPVRRIRHAVSNGVTYIGRADAAPIFQEAYGDSTNWPESISWHDDALNGGKFHAEDVETAINVIYRKTHEIEAQKAEESENARQQIEQATDEAPQSKPFEDMSKSELWRYAKERDVLDDNPYSTQTKESLIGLLTMEKEPAHE